MVYLEPDDIYLTAILFIPCKKYSYTKSTLEIERCTIFRSNLEEESALVHHPSYREELALWHLLRQLL